MDGGEIARSGRGPHGGEALSATAETGAGDGDLVLRGVGKRYSGSVALADVSLTVRRGEFLTLLGPSGSGKTTLLMIIAGFVDPSAGELSLNGGSLLRTPPEKRDFGMVFQGYALFPHMSVAANIAYPLEVRGLPRADIDARVEEMLSLVQLDGLGGRAPRQLSGGQQQRVALARALSYQPRVLLLDEPLGALDKKLRTEVQRQLKDLHRRLGATFVYVTHDQEEALSMSDRIAILREGRIVQIGAPEALYERPADVFAASFLGRSNFLRGRVAAHEGEVLTVDVGSVRLRQRADARSEAPIPAVGGPVTLALRPEKISTGAGAAGAVSEGGRIQGVVSDIDYVGSTQALTVGTEALGPLMVDARTWPKAPDLALGASVTLSWADDAAAIVKDAAP